MSRFDDRKNDALRPVRIQRHFTAQAPGSVLIDCGQTRVLCTAVWEDKVPRWMVGSGRGWVTAEYGMLPGSTHTRKDRDRGGRVDGRTVEIQRLIGRALRAVVDTKLLGERTITVDCDVLQADGGTRCTAINGAYVALVDCLKQMESKDLLFKWPLTQAVAAVSVGVVDDEVLLDLCYQEDSKARADVNVVMTDQGGFVEIQGTGEGQPFSSDEMQGMMALAQSGITELLKHQKDSLEQA